LKEQRSRESLKIPEDMNWKDLSEMAQIEEIKANSEQRSVVIFKHSTRCSISSMAKNRLDRGEAPEGIDFYYLDLLKHRNISNQIAEEFGVAHESPQILIIRNGACVYDESHNGIDLSEIAEQATA
jgi:bacillithiol system protein YtxJ